MVFIQRERSYLIQYIHSQPLEMHYSFTKCLVGFHKARKDGAESEKWKSDKTAISIITKMLIKTKTKRK